MSGFDSVSMAPGMLQWCWEDLFCSLSTLKGAEQYIDGRAAVSQMTDFDNSGSSRILGNKSKEVGCR